MNNDRAWAWVWFIIAMELLGFLVVLEVLR